MMLTNIDLVGAKTGKKLAWWEKAINNSINYACSGLIKIAVVGIVSAVAYLIVKLIIFLVNV
jgi:hypothetical protein